MFGWADWKQRVGTFSHVPASGAARSAAMQVRSAGPAARSKRHTALQASSSHERLGSGFLFLVRTLCGSDDADPGNRSALKMEPSREAWKTRKELSPSKRVHQNPQLKLSNLNSQNISNIYIYNIYFYIRKQKTLKTPPGGDFGKC